MEPGCTAHIGPIWVPIWDPYRLLAGLFLDQIHLARILQYASTLVKAPLPCNSQLHILPINIFDNFSK